MEKAEFESFYRKTIPGLRSYLRVACGDRSLAEDLSQESFYRFLRSGLSGLNEFQMRSYIYKTGRVPGFGTMAGVEKRGTLAGNAGSAQPVAIRSELARGPDAILSPAQAETAGSVVDGLS